MKVALRSNARVRFEGQSCKKKTFIPVSVDQAFAVDD